MLLNILLPLQKIAFLMHQSHFIIKCMQGLLEELTSGLYVGGDVNVQAVIATALPSLPSKSLQERVFEKWQLWRAPSLPKNPINLFIGVLSAPDHFAQRLAIRSAWFQSEPIKSSRVVTRFFVAMVYAFSC
jgi:hypothetical protein